MNIKHLEHLLALADTGSFSRAAEQCFITQSALSRSIQGLEDELGGPVLDRLGKRNTLTPRAANRSAMPCMNSLSIGAPAP